MSNRAGAFLGPADSYMAQAIGEERASEAEEDAVPHPWYQSR